MIEKSKVLEAAKLLNDSKLAEKKVKTVATSVETLKEDFMAAVETISEKDEKKIPKVVAKMYNDLVEESEETVEESKETAEEPEEKPIKKKGKKEPEEEPEDEAVEEPEEEVVPKKKGKKEPEEKPIKKKVESKKPAKEVKSKAPKKEGGSGIVDLIFGAVKKSKKGISTKEILDETGVTPKQLNNGLYKLVKTGKVTSKSRGVYIAS